MATQVYSYSLRSNILGGVWWLHRSIVIAYIVIYWVVCGGYTGL